MAKITFDDTPYRASHGKAPRGRGTWCFTTHRHFADGDIQTIWGYGTLTEAKRMAAKALREYNAGRISTYSTLYVQG